MVTFISFSTVDILIVGTAVVVVVDMAVFDVVGGVDGIAYLLDVVSFVVGAFLQIIVDAVSFLASHLGSLETY